MTTTPATQTLTVTRRRNGKIDVRSNGRRIAALSANLSPLAGRYLTDDEVLVVMDLVRAL